jgi:hypothetical protein
MLAGGGEQRCKEHFRNSEQAVADAAVCVGKWSNKFKDLSLNPDEMKLAETGESQAAPRRPAKVDLWKRTLEQIPTLYGRLVYLTSLRNSDSGEYQHHGLALVFGAKAADEALRESHWETFQEWLASPLAQQKADVTEYMAQLPTDRAVLVENWLQIAPYRNLPPAEARFEERELFCADLETLLQLLKDERTGAARNPGA